MIPFGYETISKRNKKSLVSLRFVFIWGVLSPLTTQTVKGFHWFMPFQQMLKSVFTAKILAAIGHFVINLKSSKRNRCL